MTDEQRKKIEQRLGEQYEQAMDDLYSHVDDNFLTTAEIRTRAQNIVDWANWRMGEVADSREVTDPWGKPVDRRGM